jgi:hypothetical protein
MQSTKFQRTQNVCIKLAVQINKIKKTENQTDQEKNIELIDQT